MTQRVRAGKDGWTLNEYPEGRGEGMGPLLDAIVESIPAPSASPDLPFKMLVTMLEHDNYVGRIATGRVAEGIVREGDRIKLMPVDGSAEEEGRVRSCPPPAVKALRSCSLPHFALRASHAALPCEGDRCAVVRVVLRSLQRACVTRWCKQSSGLAGLWPQQLIWSY